MGAAGESRKRVGSIAKSIGSKKKRRVAKLAAKPLLQSEVPFPAAPSDDEGSSLVDEGDVEFVDEYTGQLGFLRQLQSKELDSAIRNQHQQQGQQGHSKQKVGQKAGQVSAASPQGSNDKAASDSDDSSDGLEELQEYERRPRQQWGPIGEKTVAQLPIKTLDGRVVFEEDEKEKLKNAAQLIQRVEGVSMEEIDNTAEDSEAEVPGSKGDSDLGGPLREVETGERAEAEKDSKPNTNKIYDWNMELKEAQAFQDRALHIEQMKELMAVAASKLVENPQENAMELKRLLEMLVHPVKQISKLAMLTLMTIFKDIAPAYRIRLPTEKELQMRVSKEVASLRSYESFLLRSYQAFLKQLFIFSKNGKSGSNGEIQHKRVAIRCLCGLLTSLGHFNYSSDLLQAVIPNMADKDTDVRKMCCDAIRDLISGDTDGKITLEAVQLVADFVRRWRCKCHPEVVSALMELRFPDLRHDRQDDEGETKLDVKKMKRKTRGKRFRDDVDKAFEMASAGSSVTEKAAVQSKTVEALYEIFFRVLKHCTKVSSNASRQGKGVLHSIELHKKCPLLYLCLKGLSQYCHVLSMEYFVDLLQVFQQLLSTASLPFVERLQCLLTASDMLRGEGSSLNVDRRDLDLQLYQALLEIERNEDLETGCQPERDYEDGNVEHYKDLGVLDGHHGVLLLRVINQMLCETKSYDNARLAAFAKRLLCRGLHEETGCVIGLEAVVNRLLLRNHRLRGMLDGEGSAPAAGKKYDPSVMDPSDAGGLSATLWELCLLARHYHPHAAQGAQQLMAIPLEPGMGTPVNGVLSTISGPVGLAAQYATSSGAFHPAPQQPPKKRSKAANKLSFLQQPIDFVAAITRSCDGQETDAEVEEEKASDEGELHATFQKLYRQWKGFHENSVLRRTSAVLKKQVAEFHEHLGTRRSENRIMR